MKLIILILGVLVATMAFAQVPGAETTFINTSRLADTTAGNVTLESGNITFVNVSSTFVTSRWTGILGSISGEITLGDIAGATMFDWTLTQINDSIVYVTNDTTSFGNISAANGTSYPSFTVGAFSDNFTNTFTGTGNFSDSNLIGSITNASYADTYKNSTAGDWRTFALYDNDDDAIIMAGLAQENTQSYAEGVQVDYQIIAPASSVSRFYFYLELS